ncbi:MAG: MBL fold metallo-hydrolase [Candidatus Omnitrophica bacterium]|nr:MBL fold metallo-hydrolase [Candidatus Omnitrophota bacterium]
MDKGLIVRTIVVGPLQTNCYVLGCANTYEAVIIDPGADCAKINAVVKQEKLKLKAVVLTHGHYDHIGCLDSFDLPVYIHADDAEMLTNSQKNLSANFGIGQEFNPNLKILKDDDIVSVGDLRLKVIHTPGHSRGGICLQVRDVLFSGDTLFCHGVGRTDLPGGSFKALLDSINNKLIKALEPETLVFPGHGPSTTISQETRENNYL